MMRLGPVARAARAAAGIDQRRSLPAFARPTLRRSAATAALDAGERPDVWIWADSFTDHFLPAERTRRDPGAGGGRPPGPGDRRRTPAAR